MQSGENARALPERASSWASAARGTLRGLMGIAVPGREAWRLRGDGRAPESSHTAFTELRVVAPRTCLLFSEPWPLPLQYGQPARDRQGETGRESL